jgi:sulfite exporter TauE/SafE
MIALMSSVLVTTMLGSLHCAGMCGGFVCFVAGENGGARRAMGVAAYNAGRLITYVTLGLLAGAVGAGLDRIGSIAGVSRAAAVVAGGLMILWGGTAWWRAIGRGKSGASPARWRLPIAAAMRRALQWHPVARAFVLGLVTTFLPCGFLYAFVAIAAGTGAAFAGALVMVVFWAGTLPVMASLALVAQRALNPLRRRLPAFTAPALIVLGLLTLAGKMNPAGLHSAHHAAGPASTAAAPAPHASHGASHGGR